MNGIFKFVATASLALAFLAAAHPGTSHAPLDPRANPLVQPKVYELIDTAESALHLGDFNKAFAYSDLVLLRQTIPVSLDTSAIPAHFRPQAERAFHRALHLWTHALDHEIAFVPATANRPPDVRVAFTPSVRLFGREVAGHAVWSRQVHHWGFGRYDTRVSSDIRVRTFSESGTPLSEDAQVHTLAHEIGHVLGLWDSPRVGDIMGPLDLDRPVLAPSPRELQALREARAQANVVLQQALLLP